MKLPVKFDEQTGIIVDDKREQQISKAWANEADRVDKLEALCRKLAEATDHLLGIVENISISDTQYMRDRLADAIAKVNVHLSDARKAGIIK